MSTSVPPFGLVRVAVCAVWLYEGLWCKLLYREQGESQIIEMVPYVGPRGGKLVLGVIEVAITVWALSGWASGWCALAQTLLLLLLNTGGLLWARQLIHDPGGMIIGNGAFLVLVWVSASQSGWR